MATVASGIDETSNVVQLNGFFGKRFYFYNLFSQSATLPVYLFNLCLYLSISCQSPVNLRFFISLFFSAESFSRIYISCAIDKLLNLSRVNSHEQFIFGKQSLSLFRGNTAFQQNRCYFPHSLDMLKTGLFFTYFVKMNC